MHTWSNSSAILVTGGICVVSAVETNVDDVQHCHIPTLLWLPMLSFNGSNLCCCVSAVHTVAVGKRCSIYSPSWNLAGVCKWASLHAEGGVIILLSQR